MKTKKNLKDKVKRHTLTHKHTYTLTRKKINANKHRQKKI